MAPANLAGVSEHTRASCHSTVNVFAIKRFDVLNELFFATNEFSSFLTPGMSLQSFVDLFYTYLAWPCCLLRNFAQINLDLSRTLTFWNIFAAQWSFFCSNIKRPEHTVRPPAYTVLCHAKVFWPRRLAELRNILPVSRQPSCRSQYVDWYCQIWVALADTGSSVSLSLSSLLYPTTLALDGSFWSLLYRLR